MKLSDIAYIITMIIAVSLCALYDIFLTIRGRGDDIVSKTKKMVQSKR